MRKEEKAVVVMRKYYSMTDFGEELAKTLEELQEEWEDLREKYLKRLQQIAKKYGKSEKEIYETASALLILPAVHILGIYNELDYVRKLEEENIKLTQKLIKMKERIFSLVE